MTSTTRISLVNLVATFNIKHSSIIIIKKYQHLARSALLKFAHIRTKPHVFSNKSHISTESILHEDNENTFCNFRVKWWSTLINLYVTLYTLPHSPNNRVPVFWIGCHLDRIAKHFPIILETGLIIQSACGFGIGWVPTPLLIIALKNTCSLLQTKCYIAE